MSLSYSTVVCRMKISGCVCEMICKWMNNCTYEYLNELINELKNEWIKWMK